MSFLDAVTQGLGGLIVGLAMMLLITSPTSLWGSPTAHSVTSYEFGLPISLRIPEFILGGVRPAAEK